MVLAGWGVGVARLGLAPMVAGVFGLAVQGLLLRVVEGGGARPAHDSGCGDASGAWVLGGGGVGIQGARVGGAGSGFGGVRPGEGECGSGSTSGGGGGSLQEAGGGSAGEGGDVQGDGDAGGDGGGGGGGGGLGPNNG